jgi:hypothetical protein
MATLLLTLDEFRQLAKPVAMTLGTGEVTPYIEEAQGIDIMPYLGEALVLDIVEYVDGKPGTPDYSTLLSGGIYTTAGCPPRRVEFAGLKKALAYYVYSRLVKNTPYALTRYGDVNKTDQYSVQAERSERSVMERDARSTADYHAAACARYLQANRATFPLYPGGKPEKNNARLRVIPPSC